jgi:hypothetical protein
MSITEPIAPTVANFKKRTRSLLLAAKIMQAPVYF